MTRVLPKGYRPPTERDGVHGQQFFVSLIELRDYWLQLGSINYEIGPVLDILRRLQAESAQIAACNQCADPLADLPIVVHSLESSAFYTDLEALIGALENLTEGDLPAQLDFLDLIPEAPMQ
jgi:hypothetical protein